MAAQPTELYDFSTDTGITIPDTEDLRSSIVTRIVSAFGPNVDTSEETHIGRFIDELTEIVVQTTGINAQNANQFNLNYATGTFLDNLGAAYGLSRVMSSHTTVVLTMTCSQSRITIPQGTLFESDDGYDFVLNADVPVTNANATVVDGVTVYVVTGQVSAVESGRSYCPAGTLKTIKSSVLGLVSVTNAAAGDVGSDLETDDHFRGRIRKMRETGSASPGAIMNAIFAIKDSAGNPLVSDALALENGHAYPVKKRGIVLPAHSIYVCVTGDDGSGTSETAIATAIYNTKTAGADYTKTTVSSALIANRRDITVTDPSSGVASVVSFFRPVLRGLRVDISIDTSNYTGTNPQNAVVEAIQNYLSTEGIGANITAETVVAAIVNTVDSTIVVRDLKLTYDGVSVEGIVLSVGEMFTTATDVSANPRLEVVFA